MSMATPPPTLGSIDAVRMRQHAPVAAHNRQCADLQALNGPEPGAYFRGSSSGRSAMMYAITAKAATHRCISAGFSLSGVSAGV